MTKPEIAARLSNRAGNVLETSDGLDDCVIDLKERHKPCQVQSFVDACRYASEDEFALTGNEKPKSSEIRQRACQRLGIATA